MKYKNKNTVILYQCKKTITVLFEFHNNFEHLLKYFQGCVDDGIVPPESMEKNLHLLPDFNNGTSELIETIREYMRNIETADDDIEDIQRVIIQDRKIIPILENRTVFREKDFENFEKVLIDCTKAVDYWYAQKNPGSGCPSVIKGLVHFSRTRYDSLVKLLNYLTEEIKRHLYGGCREELETYTPMKMVYAPPERMNRNIFKNIDLFKDID